ncbi:MAG: hypothetical protein PVF45_11865 [Anaerolineae bacterium]
MDGGTYEQVAICGPVARRFGCVDSRRLYKGDASANGCPDGTFTFALSFSRPFCYPWRHPGNLDAHRSASNTHRSPGDVHSPVSYFYSHPDADADVDADPGLRRDPGTYRDGSLF